MSDFTLADLEAIVAARAQASPDESWTAKLVQAGQSKAAKKLGEEAVEAVIAAIADDRKNLTDEAADLLYHLLVVLKIADVPLSDVMAVMNRGRVVELGVPETIYQAPATEFGAEFLGSATRLEGSVVGTDPAGPLVVVRTRLGALRCRASRAA